MRISRDASAEAYGLTIELDGIDTAAVQVSAVGQSLVISRERSEQQVQEDSFDDGRGFVRSFSYSSGSASRRVSVPPDGDLSAMRREDGDGRIRITIPRQGRSGND
jgi:HSP20 family molecular chaperone IbpA